MRRSHKENYTTEITVHDGMTCDLCGKESHFKSCHTWGTTHFEVQDVTVEWESGHSYPEDRYTLTKFVDVCPDCFRTKLIPWLESQGATIKERECG
jgi:hypothetical protein